MNLVRLPSGSWRVTVSVGGRRRTGTRPTRREAAALGAELLTALEAETDPRRLRIRNLTVEHVVDRYMANATRWSPTTRAELTRARSRIPADMLERRADEVGPLDLDDMYRRLAATIAPGGVRRVHELLSAAYRAAQRLEAVRSNPAALVAPPSPAKRRPTAPGPALLRVLAVAISDPKFAAFIRLAWTTGARRGELSALRWSDLDLDAGTVTVARAVVWTKASGLVVKGTKTGNVKTLALDDGTVAALRALRSWRAEHEHLVMVGADAHVFGVADQPARPDWSTQRWVRLRGQVIAAEKAQARKQGRKPDPSVLAVASVRLHDLRHFTATQLLAAGVDPVTVAGRLGHANPQTTLRIYSHVLPERDRAAADLIGGLG